MRTRPEIFLLVAAMSAFLMGQELPEVEDEQSSQDLTEYLLFMQEHPINLNHAGLNRLMELPYITPYRVLVLERYLRDNPGLDDPYLLVRDSVLESSELEGLMPYICFDSRDPAQTGFLKLSTRVQRRWPQDEWGNSPWENRSRVRYRWGDHCELFLQSQHDPGEQAWGDYYSGNVSWADGEKSAVLGDYQVTIGRGLMFGGNSPSVFSSYWAPSGGLGAANVRPYHSSHEYRAMRGVCLQGTLPGMLRIIGFASRRKIDAAIDSSDRITGIYDDGYHRTGSELGRKNNSSEMLLGGRAGLGDGRSYDIGITACRRWFDRAILMEPYNPSLFGFDGGLAIGKITALGELAGSLKGLNGYSGEFGFISGNYAGRARLYGYSPGFGPPRFNSDNYYGGSDERGVTFFSMWTGPAGLDLSGAYNQFLPWQPFGLSSQGSRGCRCEVRLDQKMPAGIKADIRIRVLRKESLADEGQAGSPLYGLSSTALRMGMQWNVSKSFGTAANYQTSFFRDSREPEGKRGELMSLAIKNSVLGRLTLSGQMIFYYSPDYETRLYLNEPELRSGGSFHGYWGSGRRDALTARYTLGRYGSFELKIARQTGCYNGETSETTEAGMELEILLK